MIDKQVTCDVCGIAKGETNHWLLAGVVAASPKDADPDAIVFMPLSARLGEPDDDVRVKHLCGHACAQKLLSQWCETLTTPPSERRPSCLNS